ncbi:MAG: DUF4416 family protein [Candidatus Omnitrophica bacterium]|nr:DUF4416 family protein [Candidatus Omnitrophota bacterium]
MAEVRFPSKTKLIAGLITSDTSIYERAKHLLKRHFGETDCEFGPFDFNYTRYYEKEMGKGLKRYFLAFEKLIMPDRIPEIKIITNTIEKQLSFGGRRQVNIDPGYLELSKLVLATTKDYNHRIYLGKGIYAEITLYFSKNSFRGWNWTYADYRSPEYINVFNQIRRIYQKQIK